MMRRWLMRFGLWLARWNGWPTPAIMAAARDLVNELEPRPESSEWKRHQAYSRLIKRFPTERRRRLALAIELTKCGF